MISLGTGLALPAERVTFDPPEPLLYLVPHGKLRALYNDLGSLHRLSPQGWEILRQSCANRLPDFFHGIAAPARNVRQAPAGRALSYAVQAESPALQGQVLELAQRSATTLIAGFPAAPSPDWSLLAGKEIRAWALRHEVLLLQRLPAVMLHMEHRWDRSFGASLKLPETGAPASLDAEAITRLFRDGLELPGILGSYRLVEFLGTGPVTASFLAQHIESIHKPGFVLKVLHPSFDVIPGAAVSDLMERLRQLEWLPGVLAFDDFLVDRSHRFFITRYMHAGNLDDAVADLSGSQRIAMIVRALADVCEALALAHGRDLSHGRVSSRNILFDGQRFWLADFLSAPLEEARDGGKATSAVSETSRQKDLQDLVLALQALWEGQPFEPPTWLADLIRDCTAEPLEDRPSATDLVRRYVLPLAEAKESLAILTVGRERRRDRMHYDLDLGEQRVIEMLRHHVGDARIEDLCALWDAIGQPASLEGRSIEELFEQVGELASRQILGPELHGRLAENPQSSLWLIYDPETAAIPWELLALKGLPLCRRVPLARSPRVWPESGHLNRAMGRMRTLKPHGEIRVLLIADPTGTLPFARTECDRLLRELERCCLADRLRIEVADRSTNSVKLFSAMQRSHVIHFAGHAEFSIDDPVESALLLKGGERLRAGDLRGFWEKDSVPLLFFANTCSSGRSPQETSGWLSNVTMGLGQAFLTAGVGTYVGTAWSLPDDPRCEDFASVFHRHFFSGSGAGRAMMSARNESCSKYGPSDLTWARYILFGHPQNRIELLQRSES